MRGTKWTTIITTTAQRILRITRTVHRTARIRTTTRTIRIRTIRTRTRTIRTRISKKFWRQRHCGQGSAFVVKVSIYIIGKRRYTY